MVESGLRPGTISITLNLDVALRHLRHEHESRHTWIDALYVNQKDDGDKSAQVTQMSRVYKQADRTVSLLGPEASNSNKVIEMLEDLAGKVEVSWDDFDMQSS